MIEIHDIKAADPILFIDINIVGSLDERICVYEGDTAE